MTLPRKPNIALSRKCLGATWTDSGHWWSLFGSFALGDNEGNVVVLLAGAEPPNVLNDGRQQVLRRQFTIPPQCFSQPLFAELFSRGVEGFSNAVGVESDRVSGKKLAFPDSAVPFPEEPEDGTSSSPAVPECYHHGATSRKMSAIGITQTLRLIVVFGEEERGVGAVGGVVVEQLVYGAQ